MLLLKYSYFTYKYRIYPTEQQIHLIELTLNATKVLYNLALDDMIKQYEQTGAILKLSLDDYKREPHYNFDGIDALALSHVLIELQNNFSKALQNNTYPKHKSNKPKQSYSVTAKGNRIFVKDGFVYLPYVGNVKIMLHREMQSHPIKATITRESNGTYYIAFLFREVIPRTDLPLATPDNTLGLDYSSPHFYVDSNGNTPNHPRFYKQEEEHLNREIAKLRRKQHGSSNWHKQLQKVRKIYNKIANRRKDWLHKESTRLADSYDIIAVEDLDLQAIAGYFKLGKNTMDNAYRKFIEMLDYKMEQRGNILFKVNRYITSSQTCNKCGYVNKQLQLSDRFWKCPNCGKLIARDHNAAVNIKEQALKHLG